MQVVHRSGIAADLHLLSDALPADKDVIGPSVPRLLRDDFAADVEDVCGRAADDFLHAAANGVHDVGGVGCADVEVLRVVSEAVRRSVLMVLRQIAGRVIGVWRRVRGAVVAGGESHLDIHP